MAYLRDRDGVGEILEVILDHNPLLEMEETEFASVLSNAGIETVGDLRDAPGTLVSHLALPSSVIIELKQFLPLSALGPARTKERASRSSSQSIDASSRSDSVSRRKKRNGKPKGGDEQLAALTAGRKVRNLQFQLHSAELPKSVTSTFGTFELGKQKFISSTVWGERNPVYLKKHKFNNVKLKDLIIIRIFEVNRKKKPPKLVGLCAFTISELAENVDTTLSLGLYSPTKDGSISGKMVEGASVRVQHFLLYRVLLPDKYYDPLVKILTEPKFTVCVYLEKLVEETGADVAQYLVHVLTHHSKMHLYLDNWIERELSRSDDTAVLFRGDSLGIKAFDVFLSWIGKDYLTETLASHVKRVVDEDLRCELEEIKLEKNDRLRANFDNFLGEANKITSSIFSSDYDAPAEFCYLFGVLTSLVMEKFPYKLEVSVIAINGFLFLRFFVPALMSPALHGLWEGHLAPGPAGTLNLLARVVQKLANMNLFDRDREPHLHLLNDFLREQQREISLFVGKLAERKVRKDTLASMRRVPDPSLDITNELVELMNVMDANRGWWEQHKEVPEIGKMLRALRKVKGLESRLAMQLATNVYSPTSSS